MRILWFPRLQADIDRLHLVTWQAMSREILSRGHDLRLVVTGRPEGFPPDVLISLPAWNFPGARLLILWLLGPVLALRLKRTFRPQAVILDPFTSWFSRLWPGRGPGRPVIISDHRTPSDHFQFERRVGIHRRLRRLLDQADWRRTGKTLDGATVISDYYRELVMHRFQIDAARLAVWNSGVNSLFLTAPENKLNPAENRRELLLIQHGEWSFNRGLLETVEALSLCPDLSSRLILLGHGPARSALDARARELNLQDRVQLHPPVPHPQVPDWIDQADAAVMAYPAGEYWNCNCPVKLLEYLARNKVIIATDMPGFREVIQDLPGVYWLKSPRPDPGEIAAAIKAVAADLESWKNRARAGRNRMAERFSWSAQADRLLDFLDRLRAESSGDRQ